MILYEEHDGRTTVRWQDHGTFGEFFLLRPLNYAMERGLTEGFQANLEALKAAVEAE